MRHLAQRLKALLRQSSKRSRRGYTIVELMMALAVFSIGVTGIVGLQVITTQTNSHAKNLAIATQLARSWQEKLAMDATLWHGEKQWDVAQTTWLDTITSRWQRPAGDGDSFGPAAGALGQYVDETGNDVVFCTHVRLTQLIGEGTVGLVRTDVRVFWPKGPIAWSDGDPYCNVAAATNANVDSIGAAITQFHFVYKTSVVRQTPEL